MMRLENWVVVRNTMYGSIHGDTRGKWKDGHLIKTSTIQNMRNNFKEGDKAETRNSVYLLGKPY